MREPLRILLVDDHVLFREGVKIGLASVPGVEVVGEASDGFEALSLARETMPDIILSGIGISSKVFCPGCALEAPSRSFPHWLGRTGDRTCRPIAN